MTWPRLVATAACCAVVGMLLSALRFAPAHVALAAVAAAVLSTLVGRRELGAELAWPALAEEERGGQRHELAQISWSLTGREGRVAEYGLHQLRTVAAGRLRLAGVDPDDDAAVRAALGERAWRTLHATASAPPTLRALDACLTSLETLEGAPREP